LLKHCTYADGPRLATDSLEALPGALMPHACSRCIRPSPRATLTRGFTLIEMLVTLSIIAIFTGISAPPVFGLLANQRIKMATYDFYSALAYARSQAIQRYEVVNIVPRDNDYANGWDVRAGSGILRSQLELDRVAVSVPEKVSLAYDRYGRLTSPGRYVVRLAASPQSSVAARCVIIDPDGRARIQIDAQDQNSCRAD
jgi:type IV fimbrial biogenesis protein FimT